MLGAVVAGRLIGRERECGHLEAGPAGRNHHADRSRGVGKARLALELASRLEARDGRAVPVALLGELGADADAEGVAGALGFGPIGAATVVLAEARIDRARQLRARAPRCSRGGAELQAAVPELIMLVTSREGLGILGEQVIVVDLPLRAGPIPSLPPPSSCSSRQARAAGAELGHDWRARGRRRAVPAAGLSACRWRSSPAPPEPRWRPETCWRWSTTVGRAWTSSW